MRALRIFFFFLLCYASLTATIFAAQLNLKNDSTQVVAQKSFIRSMNEDQLKTLIDYLFEMDSIPATIITEVNSAIATIHLSKDSLQYAYDIYTDWDEKNIFSMSELNSKKDTSYTLNLLTAQHSEFCLPFNGIITSKFGWRGKQAHNGIDIDLNKGDRVGAAFDGKVRFAKWQGGFGNVVVLRHKNGLETLYAHLSKIKVKVGQDVLANELIGLGGSTGRSSGSHLHFEVRLKSKPVNPSYLISFSNQTLISNTLTFKATKFGWAVYPPNVSEYVAEKGDTVFEVAKRFGISPVLIAQKNGLNRWQRLKPGQKIVI